MPTYAGSGEVRRVLAQVHQIVPRELHSEGRDDQHPGDDRGARHANGGARTPPPSAPLDPGPHGQPGRLGAEDVPDHQDRQDQDHPAFVDFGPEEGFEQVHGDDGKGRVSMSASPDDGADDHQNAGQPGEDLPPVRSVTVDRQRAQVRQEGRGKRGREHLPQAVRRHVDDAADQPAAVVDPELLRVAGTRNRDPGDDTSSHDREEQRGHARRHGHRLAPRRTMPPPRQQQPEAKPADRSDARLLEPDQTGGRDDHRHSGGGEDPVVTVPAVDQDQQHE